MGARHLRITPAELRVALSQLEIRAHIEDDDESFDLPDVIIQKNLTQSDALQIMEKKNPVILAYDDGLLFAIEAPRQDHGAVAGILVNLIRDQVPNPRLLLTCGGQNIVLGGRIKQPDESLSPFPRLQQLRHPSVVVEVAVTQGLLSVYRLATQYLATSTDIQVVLMVKLWKRFVQAGVFKRRMLFLSFIRNANPNMHAGLLVPDTVVSFGNEPLLDSMVSALVQLGVPQNQIMGFIHGGVHGMCSQLGQAQYMINLPANHIFYGASHPIPPGLINGLTVDLFNVQEIGLTFDK